MQPPLKSAVTKVLVIYMKSSVWVYFFLCFLVCLCVSLKGILCHICTLRRDEHLFVSRAQILECLCTGRCMSVCAANMFKLSSGHNWVCKVSHSSLLPTAEPCSRCELQWRPLVYKTFSAGAVYVGYPCDTKSKLVMGHYLLGCEEKLHMEPCQVQAPCAMPFYFTGGQPSEGNFSLRESVLHSSSPKPCHVLSIDPFCSFQKKTWLRGEVKEGNSLSVHGSSGQPSLVLLAWKMIPCQNTWPRRGVLTMTLSSHRGTVILGKARSGLSAWGRSRVCIWIQEWLKFRVRWPMHLSIPRRNPRIAPLSAIENWSRSCSHLDLPAQTQKLHSPIFSILLLTGCTSSLSPAPSSPVCIFLSPKKSLRERDLSFQRHADPFSPPLKVWN